MAQHRPARGGSRDRVYGSEDLALLSRVLDGSLKVVVESTGAPLSDEEMQDFSSRLGKVIMDHFEAGETDPESLKSIAVESVQWP